MGTVRVSMWTIVRKEATRGTVSLAFADCHRLKAKLRPSEPCYHWDKNSEHSWNQRGAAR